MATDVVICVLAGALTDAEASCWVLCAAVLLTVAVSPVEDERSVVADVATLVTAVLAFPLCRFAMGPTAAPGTYRSHRSRISLEPELNRDENEGCWVVSTTAWPAPRLCSWSRRWLAEAKPRDTRQHSSSASTTSRLEAMDRFLLGGRPDGSNRRSTARSSSCSLSLRSCFSWWAVCGGEGGDTARASTCLAQKGRLEAIAAESGSGGGDTRR